MGSLRHIFVCAPRAAHSAASRAKFTPRVNILSSLPPGTHGAPRINTPTPPVISQYRAHHTAFYPISCPHAILTSSRPFPRCKTTAVSAFVSALFHFLPLPARFSPTACPNNVARCAPPRNPIKPPPVFPTQTTTAHAFVSAPSSTFSCPRPSRSHRLPQTMSRAPAFPMRSRVSLSAHPAHKFWHGYAPRAAPINSPCPAEKRHAAPFRAAPFPHSSRHSPFFDTSFPTSPRNFRKNSQKIAFFSLQMVKNGL